MEEEYILKYTGEETDALLKHTESLKDQTTAEDGETVQVYDESGIPHKIAKTELLNKAILATTSIQDISKFIAINEAGDAVGIMTLEQITEVFRKEFAKFPSSSETSAVVAVNKEGDALELMSNEKLAQVVGGLLKNKTFAESIGGLWNNNEIYDLNDSLTTGLYVAKANNETDNSPSQDSCLVAVLSDANYSMQLAVTLNLDNIYFRRIVKYTQRYGEWIILK